MENIKIIGICGGSASGKTSISKMISEKNKDIITLLSQDSYYKSYDELSFDQKKKINYDHPDAFDIDLLKQHLNDLKNNCIIECPIYSFNNYCREKETLRIISNNIILIEGMLILYYPEIRDLLDFSIYIDVNEHIRLKRMIFRDVNERGRTVSHVLKQYERDMKPMHDKFVELQKEYASIVINGNNIFDIVYNDVIEYIQSLDILSEENDYKTNK